MLKGKCVVLGVTGSIAAYKIANLASMLIKNHADVHVIMTKNATNFINPITFETLTKHKCLVDTFDRNFTFDVEHVSLAKQADVFLVAPASADVIAKMAHGIADDMLTTTLLATTCPRIVAPAMNTRMYENEIVQDNLTTLRHYGFRVLDPAEGYLACGDIGKGKMPEPSDLLDAIAHEIAYEKDLAGKKVLITAGPTKEAIDPVRFLSNHSTGKMGYALAEAAALRGADVTLISGEVALDPPAFVHIVPVVSAKDMAEAVKEAAPSADFIIKAAAVADFRPKEVATEKIKKDDAASVIELTRTEDILSYLGANKKMGQVLCGFSMETEHLLENSKKKLEEKNADLIVANNLKTDGAGFGTDTNVVTIITRDGAKELPQLSKKEVAHRILDEMMVRSMI